MASSTALKQFVNNVVSRGPLFAMRVMSDYDRLCQIIDKIPYFYRNQITA